MPLSRAVHHALTEQLGAPVSAAEPVVGGDVCEAWKLWVSDRPVFCKTLESAPAGLFAAEARGLAWLGSAGGLAVPEVLGHGPDWLALDWIAPGHSRAATDEAIGRGLARTHRLDPGAAGPGDTFIARIPQPALAPDADWAVAYREQRLLPLVRRTATLLGSDLVRDLEVLAGSLEDRVGAPEPLARLHGDLWSGNLHIDEGGEPWLIDPAATRGHREVDLAMMALFGGFGPAVFAAYDEVAPLQPGWRERLPLYQLYFLLVHVALFGRGWVGRVQDVVRRLG